MKNDLPTAQLEYSENQVFLNNCLYHWTQQYGERIALTNEEGESLSYSELNAHVERLAAGLYAAGLREGDIALVHMPNSFGLIKTMFALLRLGSVPIMAMPNQSMQDISTLMELAKPSAYFISNGLGEIDHVMSAQMLSEKHECLLFVGVDGENVQSSGKVCSLETLEMLSTCPYPEKNGEDVALLLLSGGTTGRPKLIPRQHSHYFYNFTASAQLCGFNRDMVFLAVLPIAHNFTLASPGILGTLQCGGRVVVSASANCDEAMPLIERERVTHVALVPPLAKLWVDGRDWENSDISSLKLVQVGGSRLEPGLAKLLIDTLGCPLQQVFGMAEGLLCYTRLDDPLETIINTQGRPLSPEDEVRVVDENDQEVAVGQLGHLMTRGPYTVRNYFKSEKQSMVSFNSDGFYLTGDLVRRDEQGNFIVEGRIKELINRCGEKISVAEIEQAVAALHGVHSVVAVGVPDDLLGERICVFIKSENRELNYMQLKIKLRENGLSDYKIPDQVEMISEWPLTAARKIDRRSLIALATQRTSKAVNLGAVRYLQEAVEVDCDPLKMALKFVHQIGSADYVLYERNGEWSLGIGKAMEISVDNSGTVHRSDGRSWKMASISSGVSQALSDLPFENWRAYGRADFELAFLLHGIESTCSQGSLLKIVIPRHEVRVTEKSITLRSLDVEGLHQLKVILDRKDIEIPLRGSPVEIDVRASGRDQYQKLVASAVTEMRAYLYQKVILARSVQIPAMLDMRLSYQAGREANTPARSFLLKDGDFEAYGFSPEIVLAVDGHGNVRTQPLAGTRALTGNPMVDKQLRRELMSDAKEIAEHAVSVKLAVQEMLHACGAESVCVDEFMSVLERGSVQHLASNVKGTLLSKANAWTAFEALFPAVTASGIPKKEALDSINRHEQCKRGLYSGAVLIADSNGSLEAALTLRSVYRDSQCCWIQAGAGLVPDSTPEREWEETCEKLLSVAPYLYESKS